MRGIGLEVAPFFGVRGAIGVEIEQNRPQPPRRARTLQLFEPAAGLIEQPYGAVQFGGFGSAQREFRSGAPDCARLARIAKKKGRRHRPCNKQYHGRSPKALRRPRAPTSHATLRNATNATAVARRANLVYSRSTTLKTVPVGMRARPRQNAGKCPAALPSIHGATKHFSQRLAGSVCLL